MNTELLDAIKKHDLIAVQNLIMQDPSLITSTMIEGSDEYDAGITPIYYATCLGFTDIVEMLVAHGADCNNSIKTGKHENRTPLYIAVSNGHTDLVRYFATLGANIHAELIAGEDCYLTPLILAILQGHLTTVKFLVEEQDADVNYEIQDGKYKGHTALHAAAGTGNLAAVQYLVAKNANVNHIIKSQDNDSTGFTPLLEAARHGHVEVLKYLVEHGADVNYIVQNGDCKGCTALHIAAAADNLEAIQYLVEKNIDVNHVDAEGFTALLNAAAVGKLAIAKYLIQHGADVNYIVQNGDYQGWTALYIATKNENFDIMLYLLEKISAAQGVSPLFAAVRSGYVEAVQCLVERGADVNYIVKDGDFKGDTTVVAAVLSNSLDILRYLTEIPGLDINYAIQDGHLKGHTALSSAVLHESIDAVKLLIEKNAHLNEVLFIGGQKICIFCIMSYKENIDIMKALFGKLYEQIEVTKFLNTKLKILSILPQDNNNDDLDINKVTTDCIIAWWQQVLTILVTDKKHDANIQAIRNEFQALELACNKLLTLPLVEHTSITLNCYNIALQHINSITKILLDNTPRDTADEKTIMTLYNDVSTQLHSAIRIETSKQIMLLTHKHPNRFNILQTLFAIVSNSVEELALTELYLKRSLFTHLALALQNNTSVKELSFANKNIDNETLANICTLLLCNNITDLDLSNNPALNDFSIDLLIGVLPYNTSLVTLNLSGNQFSEEKLAQFADALQKNKKISLCFPDGFMLNNSMLSIVTSEKQKYLLEQELPILPFANYDSSAMIDKNTIILANRLRHLQQCTLAEMQDIALSLWFLRIFHQFLYRKINLPAEICKNVMSFVPMYAKLRQDFKNRILSDQANEPNIDASVIKLLEKSETDNTKTMAQKSLDTCTII